MMAELREALAVSGAAVVEDAAGAWRALEADEPAPEGRQHLRNRTRLFVRIRGAGSAHALRVAKKLKVADKTLAAAEASARWARERGVPGREPEAHLLPDGGWFLVWPDSVLSQPEEVGALMLRRLESPAGLDERVQWEDYRTGAVVPLPPGGRLLSVPSPASVSSTRALRVRQRPSFP